MRRTVFNGRVRSTLSTNTRALPPRRGGSATLRVHIHPARPILHIHGEDRRVGADPQRQKQEQLVPGLRAITASTRLKIAVGADAERQGELHGRRAAWKSAIAGHNLCSLARTGGAYWSEATEFGGLFGFDRWNDLTDCRALIQMHFSAKLPFGSPKLTEGCRRV